MVRMRYPVAVLTLAASVGVGAAWAAGGGSTTSPSTTTATTTTPSTTAPGTTPGAPSRHHCPNMGSGSSSSSSSGAPYAPTTNL
jgi:hypothetical protein